MIRRRTFLGAFFGAAATLGFRLVSGGSESLAGISPGGVPLSSVEAGEGVFAYLQRVTGGFDATLYRPILGAANAFKEGDQIVGVAAADDVSRDNARTLLANTRLSDLDAHPLLEDQLSALLRRDLAPTKGAAETVRILETMARPA